MNNLKAGPHQQMPQHPTTLESFDHPERVVARLRPHARRLVWPSLALIGLCGASGYYLGHFPEEWHNLAALGAAVILLVVLWLLPVMSWLAKRYTITTRRIIVRQGLLVRFRQELLLSRGCDVTVRKRSLQSVFRSGDLVIRGSHAQPVILSDVPGVDLVVEVLHDLTEQEYHSSH